MTPLTPEQEKERDIAIEHAISQAVLVDDGWIREALELLWQKAVDSRLDTSEEEKEVLADRLMNPALSKTCDDAVQYVRDNFQDWKRDNESVDTIRMVFKTWLFQRASKNERSKK